MLGFREAAETMTFNQVGLKMRCKNRRTNSPAHWMIVNTPTALAFRMGSHSKRDDSAMFYEFTLEEPSKSHLTTRMVTSSLRLSAQKSAAAL